MRNVLSVTVFSAHAEVVPVVPEGTGNITRILRARGGSSGEMVDARVIATYSPRTRR